VIGAVVNGGDLVELVWTSLAAGLGVTVIYGIAILGTNRALENGREGHGGRAAAYGVLAALAGAAVLAALVAGIVAMTSG
jgi:hypothetical protein